MKKSVILLVLFCVFAETGAQNVPGDADAVFLELEKTYTLQPGGEVRLDYRHRVKLLTYYAVNRYLGETFIPYNPEFQELTIHRSQTTMADGSIVQSPPNAFNVVLPAFAANAPAYSFLREMVVTHTGLERGCVVELQYSLVTSAQFLPWLMQEEIFARKSPVQKMSIAVKLPAGTVLRHAMLNSDIEPEVRQENDFRTYTWTGNDLPIVRSENALNGHVPRLVFSTCESWRDLAAFLISNIDKLDPVGDAVKNSLRIESADSDGILALARTVAEQIGRADVDPALLGYRFLSPDQTFCRNCGHTLDKAILLTALLKDKGIETDIALISKSDLVADVPALCQFGKACLVVTGLEEDDLYIFPDGEQRKLGRIDLAGKSLLTLRPETGMLTRIAETGADENRVDITAQLVGNVDLEFSGQVEVRTSGYFHNGYRLNTIDEQKSFVTDLLSELFGSVAVENLTVRSLSREEGSFSVTVRITDAFKKTGASEMFEFVGPTSVLASWPVSFESPRRYSPLVLPAAFTERLELELTLPIDKEIVFCSDDVYLSHPVGNLEWKWEREPRRIRMTRNFVVPEREIRPSDYADFRELAVHLMADDNRIVYAE